MTENDIRKLLQEMRDEPVPADSLARVRMRVAERTSSKAAVLASWWKLLTASAIAVAALVFAVIVAGPGRKQHQQQQHTVAADVPKPMVANAQNMHTTVAVPAVAPKRLAPIRRPAVQRQKIEEQEESLVVRIETPDPDVVILLLGD